MPVPEQVAKTASKAGVSITITSFTNIVAFLLGSAASLPALSSFCIYCALGVLFDYLYSVTVFLAVLSLDIRRQ